VMLSASARLQGCRHLVQILVLLFSQGKYFGLASTVLVVPYLHATGAPGSSVIGAFDALEYSMSHGVFPFFVLGTLILTTVLVGKVFCGWACPLGLIQDFMEYLPLRKRRPSPETLAQFKDLRWACLLFSVAVAFTVGVRRPPAGDDDGTKLIGVRTPQRSGLN